MSPHQPKLAEQLKKMHTLDRYTAESRVENLKMDLGYIINNAIYCDIQK